MGKVDLDGSGLGGWGFTSLPSVLLCGSPSLCCMLPLGRSQRSPWSSSCPKRCEKSVVWSRVKGRDRCFSTVDLRLVHRGIMLKSQELGLKREAREPFFGAVL